MRRGKARIYKYVNTHSVDVSVVERNPGVDVEEEYDDGMYKVGGVRQTSKGCPRSPRQKGIHWP